MHVLEGSEHDKIILFRKFNDSIAASMAKSKLDAYGIPCFLTGEHMAGLYPGERVIPFDVRLYVFERDQDRAAEVLMEALPQDSEIVCPRCGSTRIERDFPEALSASTGSALKLLFFGIFFPHKKVCRCRDCKKEF